MPEFSDHSLRQLRTLHSDLRLVMEASIKHIDFRILEGYRSQEEQDAAFERGASTLRWPNGKHNKWPSLAVDIAPWPIDWDNPERFYFFAGQIMATARMLGVKLRWGGDWDSDTLVKDQSLFDLGHFELVE